MSSTVSSPQRPLSLGVIFLTLYIDLIGFSIIFPLGPDLLRHYLEIDGHGGVLGSLLGVLESTAAALGNTTHLPEVLFGGIISSLFSLLQFVFAPFWGSLSDKHGRRPILLFTVAGTAASYLLWFLSGSFWLFLLARLVGGAFGGNLSVATAAVADVTTRKERSRAMGLVGAAFGLGLVTGPLVGAYTAKIDLSVLYPSLTAWGVNPFSTPALLALAMSIVNLFWIGARFAETLPAEARGQAREPRLRNPIAALLSIDRPEVRRINLVAFMYSISFVAMEATLVFLSAQRFGYTAAENGLLMGYLGICSILTQGLIVRRLLAKRPETQVLGMGLVCSVLGLLLIGFAPTPLLLYVGVGLLALGSGLVNPASTGLISLYAGEAEQGRVLGLFRSLGSLSRAITPLCAGALFWTFGAKSVFAAGAVLACLAWVAARSLPQPRA
ncbi:MAG: MFS transporter [Opitutaceae bacterium]|nr:MFS transporter [Opitutaceae bacterium]